MSEDADSGVPDAIDRLGSSVVSTARGARGRSMFVGWTEDGRPIASTEIAALSEQARQALAQYNASGLAPRKIPYSVVVPLQYLVTGPAVDFADTDARPAEDQVRYTVLDATGARRDIALGERGVLGAIAASRVPWQATGTREAGIAAPAVSTVPLYTVYAPLPGSTADTGVALLFEPTLRGETNEPAFRSFVRNTISRLLVLDESQPAGARKGYLEAAGRMAGTPPSSTALQTLIWLRRAGLVEFEDSWLQGLRQSRQRAKGQFIRALRAVGFVDISDEMLDELTNPRPDYDIDPLETDQLVDLAGQMYELARKRLDDRGSAQQRVTRRSRR
ncbi:MAG: hypothetical protein ACK2T6_02475 [Anaerolineae bacterium]